jgi:hypothetical protein
MLIESIEREFKEKVSSKIRLQPEGIERYRIFTPFMFDDGDHLVVVLKKENGYWVLSDEGHTLMHLTYEIEEKLLQFGPRQEIINNVLSIYAVSDRDGELIEQIKEEDYGNALFSFLQALMKLTDLSFLTKKRVVNVVG